MHSKKREIRAIFNKRDRAYSQARWVERAIMGRADGTLYSTTDQNIWVTICETGQPIEVLNRKVAPNLGTYVLIGFNPNDLPKTRQVLGFADAYVSHEWLGPDVPLHFADTHGYGKQDCAWILREQLVRYVPVAGQNKVDIYPDARVLSDGSWWWTKTATRVDYSSVIPTSGYLICVIAVNSAGSVVLRTGTAGATKAALTAANFPTLSAGDSAYVGIILYAGMSEAHHDYGNDDFIDLTTSGAYSGTTSGITNLTGDVVADGPGSVAATIQPGAVTNSKLANMAAYTIKGNDGGASAAPQDLTATELLTMGLGAFGGAQEVVNETPNGIITTFTFTNAALSIWVLVDGVVQKAADVTFTASTTTFDLSFAPQTGSDVRVIRLAPVTPPPINDYILLQHKLNNKTEGGGAVANAWTTLPINTIVLDSGGHCLDLTSNQFQLAAGTYEIDVTSFFYFTYDTVIGLYNISDSSMTAISEPIFCGSGGVGGGGNARLVYKFTISSTKTFEMRYICERAQDTYGIGVSMGNRASNFTSDEIYRSVVLHKVG